MSEQVLTMEKIREIRIKKNREERAREEEAQRKRWEEYTITLGAHKFIVMGFSKSIDSQIRTALQYPQDPCLVSVTVPAAKDLSTQIFCDALETYLDELGFQVLEVPEWQFGLGYRQQKITCLVSPNYEKLPWYMYFSEKKIVSYTFRVCVNITDVMTGSKIPLTEEDLK